MFLIDCRAGDSFVEFDQLTNWRRPICPTLISKTYTCGTFLKGRGGVVWLVKFTAQNVSFFRFVYQIKCQGTWRWHKGTLFWDCLTSHAQLIHSSSLNLFCWKIIDILNMFMFLGLWYIYSPTKNDFMKLPSLKLTFSPLKIYGWNTFSFPFGAFRPIFRGKLTVTFRACVLQLMKETI